MSGDGGFTLHPRLAEDCRVLGDLTLSRVLLMSDSRFPWCILVPRRPNLTELHQLQGTDRTTLWVELDTVARALLGLPEVSKLNVGALGNLVPQLHLHVVGRHPEDPAWPGPVWGSGPPVVYPPEALAGIVAGLRRAMGIAGAVD